MPASSKLPRDILAAGAVVGRLVAGAGVWLHRSEVGGLRRQEHDELDAIAALKSQAVTDWVRRIRADARRAAASSRLARNLQPMEAGALGPELRTEILEQLTLARDEEPYDEALVLGSDDLALVSTREPGGEMAEATRRAAASARASREVELSGLYRTASGRVFLDAAAPVTGADGEVVGTVVLRQDAATFLYPALASWPVPTRSAETFLVMRDGDEVLYLNDLRFQPGTALSLRHPLGTATLPAARAIRGERGVFDGVDYRGIAVLTSLRGVESTPWFIVAKVDAAEVLEAARSESKLVIGLATSLLLLVAATVRLVYRRRQTATLAALAATERQHRLAQENLRTTLYSIGDGVIAVDGRGAVAVMNPVAEDLTGWREEEARGRPLEAVFRIINEESRAEVENPVTRVLREGVVVGLANHTLLIARDGTERPVADSGAPIRDDDGAVRGAVLVFRDQSEDRRREREVERLAEVLAAVRGVNQLIVREQDVSRLVEKACELLAHVRAYSTAWIIVSDANGRVVHAASSGPGGPEDDPGEAARKGRLPSCVRAGRDGGEQADRHCETCPLEPAHRGCTRVVTPLVHGGRHHGVLGVSCPAGLEITSDERALIGELGADIAYALEALAEAERRRQAELVNRRQLDEITSYYDHAPIGLAVLDRDLRYRRINHVLAEINGLPAADHVGKGVADVVPSVEPHAREVVAEIVRTGEPVIEVEFSGAAPRRDGRRTWLESWHPLRDDQGSIDAFVVMAQDVTERKRAEAERDALRARLAQADRLSSMGMLAAGVAHEINNPLSYVLYNLESLEQDVPALTDLMRRAHAQLSAQLGEDRVAASLGDDQRIFEPTVFTDVLERVREALSGTRRIKGIARSLGTFSRVERVEVGPVNLQSCVEHAITMGFNELKYRARVVKDFAPVPAVLASDGKVAQVFLNLLINAGHAIEEGHVEQNEVRIRTWSDGGWVCAEVGDTGKGIPAEHQAHVFEPFFTTKGVGIGSGLGLSICRNIVEELGGDITFTSEVGRGTRFLVRLPRMPSGWSEPSAAPGVSVRERNEARGRILIVDDEDGIRAAIKRLLGDRHEVVAVSSGAEAQELLARDRAFDLVYCDLMMPAMSGMELHAWLVNLDPGLAARVVFVTGGAFTPGASAYLAEVGNLRVEKPFDSQSFKLMTTELVLAARTRHRPTP